MARSSGNRTAIRQEAHDRASMTLDIAPRLTREARTVRKLARLLLHPARCEGERGKESWKKLKRSGARSKNTRLSGRKILTAGNLD